MVSGEIEVKEYARRLRVFLPDPPVLADPFPPGEEPDEAAVGELLERSQKFDRLLLWLSAAGSGSRATFFSACQSLGLTDDNREAGYILRRLRLLGHVESSRDGERWFIAPAVLARVAAPAPQSAYMLCGERDPCLLRALHAHAAVEETPQPAGAAPARVLVCTENPERLDSTLRAAALIRPPRQDQPALRLAEALPPLNRWPDLLTPIQLVPELYDWRRFNGREFEPVPWQRQIGLYEYVPRQGRGSRRDQRPSSVFFDDERGAFLRGDWYGLRCLARSREGLACPAYYDVLSARLALPVAWRPPEIYERALVLASGRLPERRGGWLWYDDVELDLVTLLTAKLNLASEGINPNA
jgi:hypothetical protein